MPSFTVVKYTSDAIPLFSKIAAAPVLSEVAVFCSPLLFTYVIVVSACGYVWNKYNLSLKVSILTLRVSDIPVSLCTAVTLVIPYDNPDRPNSVVGLYDT